MAQYKINYAQLTERWQLKRVSTKLIYYTFLILTTFVLKHYLRHHLKPLCFVCPQWRFFSLSSIFCGVRFLCFLLANHFTSCKNMINDQMVNLSVFHRITACSKCQVHFPLPLIKLHWQDRT